MKLEIKVNNIFYKMICKKYGKAGIDNRYIAEYLRRKKAGEDTSYAKEK